MKPLASLIKNKQVFCSTLTGKDRNLVAWSLLKNLVMMSPNQKILSEVLNDSQECLVVTSEPNPNFTSVFESFTQNTNEKLNDNVVFFSTTNPDQLYEFIKETDYRYKYLFFMDLQFDLPENSVMAFRARAYQKLLNLVYNLKQSRPDFKNLVICEKGFLPPSSLLSTRRIGTAVEVSSDIILECDNVIKNIKDVTGTLKQNYPLPPIPFELDLKKIKRKA